MAIGALNVLKPIGCTYAANEKGILPRISSAPDIVWSKRIAPVIDQIKSAYPKNLISIVLRGSVAQDTAVDGVSDLDFVIVTKNPTSHQPRLFANEPPNLKIEAIQVTLEELFNSTAQMRWLRFNLSFNGWTLYGHNIIAELPLPCLGEHAIGHLTQADHWLSSWEQELTDSADDEEDKKSLCSWLMKRIVRSLFEAIMLKERIYTRDIYPCAKAASKAFPDYSEAIWKAAEMAVFPTTDIVSIKSVVNSLDSLILALASELKSQKSASD